MTFNFELPGSLGEKGNNRLYILVQTVDHSSSSREMGGFNQEFVA